MGPRVALFSQKTGDPLSALCDIMTKVPGLYWKVKVDGKWTWRKATFMIPPGEWDLVYNVLPFRSDE